MFSAKLFDSYNPMDCSPPSPSVHGISQVRILVWVAISFSRGSSQPRDPACISCISRRILYQGSPLILNYLQSFYLSFSEVIVFFSFRFNFYVTVSGYINTSLVGLLQRNSYNYPLFQQIFTFQKSLKICSAI